MDIGDLILEGVKNSAEAAASFIRISVQIIKGNAEIEIEDDGSAEIPSCPFSEGVSAKGNKRGYGLAFIKAFDPDAVLERAGGVTSLRFRGRDDGSLIDLDQILLPIFMERGRKTFFYQKDGKSLQIESEVIPDSIRAIASFRAMVREKELEMSKLTLEDLHRIREREQEKLKKRNIHGKDIHIVVAMGTSGINAGAKVVLNTIADELEKAGLEDVILTQCGSEGDYPEPFVEVYSKGNGLTAYGAVSKSDAERIVREHIVEGKILKDKLVSVKEE